MRAVAPVLAAALAAVALLAGACGGGNAASQLVKTPDFQPKGQTKCGVEKSQSKPLIVEWPSPDRLELENKVAEGLVVVRYVGCEMTVLDRCSVPAMYRYHGATRYQDKVEMKDADDLYANLPVGAAKLEGKLQRSGRLTVDMNLVGRYEAERPSVRAEELQGACDGATHFVYGVTVGAFDFYAGGQADVGGSAGIGNLGAGAHSQSERESLTKAGDTAACEKATPADKAPPAQCGALLRLEVVPLLGTPSASNNVIAPVAAPVPAAPSSAASLSCPVGMASLPGGTFKLGDVNRTADVTPFCMDTTEVTADAYADCVRAGHCSADHLGEWSSDGSKFTKDARCTYGSAGQGKHPINCVDWNQASAYCAAQKKRLPTEEEWEWAARGAGQARTYPWGDARPDEQLCWSGGARKKDGTCEVGSYPAGDAPGGIHDLAGNVWEWTGTSWDATHVYRGGSWHSEVTSHARAAERAGGPVPYRLDFVGFRCVSR